ncbi:Uncharacterised protein [Mycobacteroides abscessus subsp. abscessus]|nr:Uncharacterised protein [Mycobacteroides abscessus subsp. abscessus]SIB96102.1 Uncharacterised protein [Mycobacteroides abscessus subsp. abscessus]
MAGQLDRAPGVGVAHRHPGRSGCDVHVTCDVVARDRQMHAAPVGGNTDPGAITADGQACRPGTGAQRNDTYGRCGRGAQGRAGDRRLQVQRSVGHHDRAAGDDRLAGHRPGQRRRLGPHRTEWQREAGNDAHEADKQSQPAGSRLACTL